MKNRTKLIILTICIIAVVAGIYFAAPFVLRILGYILSMFAPFILGYLFSALINPLANVLQTKLKIPRGCSAILVMIMTIGIIGGALVGVVWKMIGEMRNLYSNFPQMYVEWQSDWKIFSDKMSHIYASMPIEIQDSLQNFNVTLGEKISSFISSHSTPMVDSASNFAKSVPGALIAAVVFILSVYFMVVDHKKVSAFIHSIFSEKTAEKLHLVGVECGKYIGGYVKAQGIIMVVVFCIIAIALNILQADYILIISILTAFLDALPFFGSGITLWPLAVIYFISGNTKLGIGMVVIYFIIMLTRRFIEPKLVSDKIGLHPIFTLISMYIGYRLWSVIGMIIGPIVFMLFISLFKAGIFDGLIRIVKRLGNFMLRQYRELKTYIVKIIDNR